MGYESFLMKKTMADERRDLEEELREKGLLGSIGGMIGGIGLPLLLGPAGWAMSGALSAAGTYAGSKIARGGDVDIDAVLMKGAESDINRELKEQELSNAIMSGVTAGVLSGGKEAFQAMRTGDKSLWDVVKGGFKGPEGGPMFKPIWRKDTPQGIGLQSDKDLYGGKFIEESKYPYQTSLPEPSFQEHTKAKYGKGGAGIKEYMDTEYLHYDYLEGEIIDETSGFSPDPEIGYQWPSDWGEDVINFGEDY